jgi:OOP family OmpA-OmpF porin
MRNGTSAIAVGICILGIALSPNVFAQEDAGFYVGGNFGFTRADTGTIGDELRNDLVASGFSSANVSIDESDTGFKLLAGYQINRNFAIEGYYANLGTYTLSVGTTGPAVSGNGELEVTGVGVDALGMIPFGRGFSGFGRVGLFRWDSDFSFRATGPGGTASSSDSDDGTELKFGVGVQWTLTPNIRLRGEVEHYNFDEAITVLSAGIVFRF